MMALTRGYRCAIATLFALLTAPPVFPQATASGPALAYLPGSSVKLEQVIGDCDWAVKARNGTCLPTANQTVTRFNILGNGFGYSFEDNGKMLFLFGDTISKDVSAVNYHAHDPIAWSTSADPESGLLLNFYTNSDGTPLFMEPPGVAMGADDICNSGISLADGVYLICNTGADEALPDPHQNAFSILARFDEASKTFVTGRTISQLPGGHFVFAAVHASGPDVYMYGMGNYRASDIYLSKTPAAGFWAGTGTQYFAGLVNGQPTWTGSESAAVPVVQDNPTNGTAWPNDAPSVGNCSVVFASDLNLWLMIYDGGRQTGKTTGVYFSYAPQPWGPWSAPQLIFNDIRDNGKGVFIHDPKLPAPGDGLNGPVIGSNDPVTTPGGDFAPQLIERFTRVDGDTLKIYYNMSTWNPYTVVKMRSEFKITAASGATPAAGTVIEYYNPDLKNYFITADPVEQAFVDTGAVGRWQRTGNAFEAGGPNLVCRFYGNANINPATGTFFGPNSHFYTADASECAGLKALYTPAAKSWKFESNDFATTPAANGGCAGGQMPVYRAYNNGFARGIDSNHRITSNFADYQATAAGGWIGEGVVMCAPPIPVPSGIYVVNEAANLQSTATAYAAGLASSSAYLTDVAGHAIFVPIAKVLPGITTWGQFNWDWTYVDTLVQIAVSHGKKFSIALEMGFQSAGTYLQSLPSGFAATCGANCAPLFDVWVTGGSGGRCTSAYIPLPWVPNVQQFWSAAASALAAHLKQAGTYGSLTLIHLPGLSVYDEEIRLPTGSPSPAATDTQACPDGRPAYPTVINDATNAKWQGYGYSDAAVISGFKTIATAFEQAFPDRYVGLSLFNPGPNGIDFPNLTGDAAGSVAAQIVQAVTALAPGRVQLQSDNLDSNFAQSEIITQAAQNSTAVGWQTNKHAETGAGCSGGGAGSCNPDGLSGPYFLLLQNGAQNRGAYVEVWSNDVVAYPLAFEAAKTGGLYPIR